MVGARGFTRHVPVARLCGAIPALRPGMFKTAPGGFVNLSFGSQPFPTIFN